MLIVSSLLRRQFQNKTPSAEVRLPKAAAMGKTLLSNPVFNNPSCLSFPSHILLISFIYSISLTHSSSRSPNANQDPAKKAPLTRYFCMRISLKRNKNNHAKWLQKTGQPYKKHSVQNLEAHELREKSTFQLKKSFPSRSNPRYFIHSHVAFIYLFVCLPRGEASWFAPEGTYSPTLHLFANLAQNERQEIKRFNKFSFCCCYGLI